MVELDEDEDGDPVTTLVVEEKQEAPDRVQKPAKLSPSETNALNALDKAMAQNPMVAIVGAPPVERPVTTEPLWHRCTPSNDSGHQITLNQLALMHLPWRVAY